ncbi:hypothetical protein FHR32_003837 [Streptosporangium album]|uniref:Uncharacterized protein n=1 Tax=Streptosporangium album TaxID=47479 RepID=A0A7W7RX57_9ACTN|nr:hypothetical protein [Streptosporangium album]
MAGVKVARLIRRCSAEPSDGAEGVAVIGTVLRGLS